MHQEQRFVRMAHILSRLKTGEDMRIIDLQESLRSLEASEGIRLECGEKSVLRDIKELKGMGCPIVYHRSPTRQSYELLDKSWELHAAPILGGDEMTAVSLGEQFAISFLPKAVASRVCDAAKGIREANSESFLRFPDLSSLKILTPPLSGETEEIFSTLFEAWRLRRMTTIRYRDEAGKVSERTIEPQAFLFQNMTWYVRAFCHLRMEPRTFAVARTLSARLLEARFEPKPEIYQNITSDSFDSRDAYMDIAILLNTEGQQYAATHVLHARRRFITHPDGTCTMTVPEKTKHAVVEWILAQRGNAVPLAPQELVEDVKNACGKIAAEIENVDGARLPSKSKK